MKTYLIFEAGSDTPDVYLGKDGLPRALAFHGRDTLVYTFDTEEVRRGDDAPSFRNVTAELVQHYFNAGILSRDDALVQEHVALPMTSDEIAATRFDDEWKAA